MHIQDLADTRTYINGRLAEARRLLAAGDNDGAARQIDHIAHEAGPDAAAAVIDQITEAAFRRALERARGAA